MMLLVALVILIGVATPPVIEDHLEVGFCSADCAGPATTATSPRSLHRRQRA